MIHVTLKDFGQRPIGGASILVDRTRSKQLFHTSQNRPSCCSCCAFYWVTTFSSANRVSGWPRGRNIGGVTGELRRLGLIQECKNISFVQKVSFRSWKETVARLFDLSFIFGVENSSGLSPCATPLMWPSPTERNRRMTNINRDLRLVVRVEEGTGDQLGPPRFR